MRRWIPVAMVGAIAVTFPLSANAALRVVGTYGIKDTAGRTATWNVNTSTAAEREGLIPARLTRAAAPDRTYACDAESNSGGSSTVTMTGITRAVAQARFAINYNLRKGTGQLTFHPAHGRAGAVQSRTTTACTAPFDGANGVDVWNHAVDVMFEDLRTPRSWPIKRQKDGSWRAYGGQTVKDQRIVVNLRVRGTTPYPGAMCRIPLPAELKNLRSFDAVKRYLVSDGFRRPGTANRPSNTVPKGKFFILERAQGHSLGICGSRTINIVRSTGKPRAAKR